MKLFALAIFSACAVAVFAEKARFDNYRVYSVDIANAEQLDILKQLEQHADGLRFLQSPLLVGRNAEIVVPPHKFGDISHLFQEHYIKSSVKVEDLQK